MTFAPAGWERVGTGARGGAGREGPEVAGMATWDIETGVVRGALGVAAGASGGYVDQAGALQDAAGAVASALARSSTVAGEVARFVGQVAAADLGEAAQRTVTAIEATGEALLAYEQGDLAMAGHSQGALRADLSAGGMRAVAR